MKKISIKASLATGLTHRLGTMDPQVVIEATQMDAIKAIRANLRVKEKIEESNWEFEKEIGETEKKKRAIFDEIKTQFEEESKDMEEIEKQTMGRKLTEEFNKRAAEVQKESKANPDEIITVEISDDDYEKLLIPVFKKTAQLWDVNGDGGGQKLFLEVADALEGAEVCP